MKSIFFTEMESLMLHETDFLFSCIEQVIHKYGTASVPQEIFQALLISVHTNLCNYNGSTFIELDGRAIKVIGSTLEYVLVQ